MENEKNSAEHHVVVFSDHHSFRVVPGCFSVAPGDRIVFESIDTGATIYLPAKTKILSDPTRVPDLLPLEKGGTFTVSISGKAPRGAYPYAVYCDKEFKGFAIGNSDPTIIIRSR